MHSGRRLSLDELCAGPPVLRPEHASAIVRRLCLNTAALTATSIDFASIPLGPEHVSIDGGGQVHLAPGIWPTARDLGGLLQHLLQEIRQQGATRLPPGLLITAARATGAMDAAPLPSTDALARALERFDPPDPGAALRALFEAAAAPLANDSPAANVVIGASDRIDDRATGAPPLRLVTAAPRPAALVATVAFAIGVTAALRLQPREPVGPATDTTEVTIAETGAARQPDRGAPARARARPISPTGVPADRRAMSIAQPLIAPAAVDAPAAFSPSFDSRGSAVFFHTQSGNTSALKRAERDENGTVRVITIVDDAAKNYHVQPSRDGRSVAFDSDRDGVRGVYVANADGSDVRRVSGPGYAAVPTWSPDGRFLAFLRAENDKPHVWNLWLKELSSNVLIRLTNHPYGQVWGGAWFPDGRRIAYSHEDRLVVIDLGAKRTMTFASPRKGHLIRTPAVSPDGRWIMFQVHRDGAWLLDLNSGSMKRARNDPSAEEFTCTPYGRRVAFHSRRGGQWRLWVMAAR